MELTIVEMAITQMKQAVVSLNMDMFCNCDWRTTGKKQVKWRKKRKTFSEIFLFLQSF